MYVGEIPMNDKMSMAYVVVGCKSWNRRVFEEVIVNYPGEWHFIESRKDLTVDALAQLAIHQKTFLAQIGEDQRVAVHLLVGPQTAFFFRAAVIKWRHVDDDRDSLAVAGRQPRGIFPHHQRGFLAEERSAGVVHGVEPLPQFCILQRSADQSQARQGQQYFVGGGNDELHGRFLPHLPDESLCCIIVSI